MAITRITSADILSETVLPSFASHLVSQAFHALNDRGEGFAPDLVIRLQS